jgi:hypothetical protein
VRKLDAAVTAMLGLAMVSGCPSFRAHAPLDAAADAPADTVNDGAIDDATQPDADADARPDVGPAVDAGSDGNQIVAAGPVCSDDGWCWDNPLLQGNALNAVWGSSPTSVWATGNAGTILSWDGAHWHDVRSGTTRHLNGVWGSGPTDVWAVGNGGALLHYDGTAWATFSSPTTSDLHAVWASGPQDAWAVGAQSSILHWTGQWIAQTNPGSFPTDVTFVWGASKSDVWFAGLSGIIRWKDQAWVTIPPLPDAGVHITALGGSGPDNVIATGADAAGNIYVYVWNDTSWGRIYQTVGPPITSIAARSANAIWACSANLVLNFNGAAWKTQYAKGLDLRAIWQSADSGGWAVGVGGEMVRYDGTAWSEPAAERRLTFTDIWPVAGGAVPVATDSGTQPDGAAGDGGARDGGLPDRGGPSLWVSGFDPTAVAHHGGAVWRGQGGFWDTVSIGDVGPLWSVWANDASSTWAAGEALLHGDASGAPWASSGAAMTYRKIRGSSATSIWSVDASVHFSNRTAPWAQDGTQLWGLLVFSDFDVWATAASGRIFHWSQSPLVKWTALDPGTPAHALYTVAGTAPDDVWAAGDVGLIRHWDGKAWSDVASGSTQALRGLWARSASEVWAVGDVGTILRWDGKQWAASQSGTDHQLYAVAGDAAGNLWVVGEQATILHRSP